jgi:ribosomal protein S18 acetylase RimI-like enzyme
VDPRRRRAREHRGRGKIVGFTCVRHKVRQPKTMLYYIIIAPDARRLGVGKVLLDDLIQQSPHRCIELSCLKDNAEALAFYAKHGFVQSGESLKGKGWHLEKAW